MKLLNDLYSKITCAGRVARVSLICLMALCFGLVWSAPTWALVEGQRPQVLKTFKVFGSAASTGNTMMTASPPGNVNDILLPQNSARISGVPFDGKVAASYLWWTGSIDGTVDNSVDFTLPDGTKQSVTGTCQTVPSQGGFFYCRAEVTNLVNKLTGSSINGNYTVAGLRAKPGNCQQNPQICQARYAAWAMVVVWESPTFNVRRDIVLYDGFLHMDEQPTSSGITSFNLSGFKVGNPAEGSFTYFGLEGDRFLGSPPEPSNFADFISFRSSSATTGTRLSSATPNNPPGNIWNSTIALGVDLDTFDIGRSGLNLIRPNDTNATLVVGTGDGIVPGGNGESVFLGFVLMTIDTLTPNFRNTNTNKRVSLQDAGVGDTLTYTLRVTNSGALEAKNVIVTDKIPANTTYVAGSTRVDNTPVSDVGGTSPLVNGLNLGTIDFRGDNDREITFQVRITGAPANRRIENSFTVRSDEVGASTSNVVVTTIKAPQLGRFTKSVRNQTNPNGPVRPGDTLVYTIEGNNVGGVTASGIQFIDDLPKFVKFVSVFPPGGSTNSSTATGGANGTGRIDIRNISVLPNSSARIFYTVRVFTEAEFVAAGIAADKIHNTPISNQGEARSALLPSGLKTDDPSTPARDDPTVVNVSYKADFAGSAKAVKDDNGGRLEPGDVLTYTVTITNKGTRDTTVSFEDDLPTDTTNYKRVSIPTGSTETFNATGGAAGGPLLTVSKIDLKVGATARIVFQVTVTQTVKNGAQVTNVGTIIDEKDSSNRLRIQSPTLTVVAGPLLDTSTKAVTNAQNGQAVTTVAPGTVLRYTIVVKNSGNRPTTAVTIEDTIDTNLDQITPANGGTFASGKITWNSTTTSTLRAIQPGGSATVSFTARVKLATPDATRISNQAVLNDPGLLGPARTDDPATPTAGDPTVVIVSAKPKLELSKTVTSSGATPGKPGDTLTYTLVVRNTGTGIAQNVVVSDPIDNNLVNASSTNGRLTSGAIVWDKAGVPALASMAIGASVTLTFTAQIANPLDPTVRRIRNQASVVADNLQSVLSDDPGQPGVQDPTDFAVRSTPEPEFTKTVQDPNGGDVVPGDTLIYTIVLKGGGNAPLIDAIITDTVPSNLTNIQPAQGGRLSGNTITWDKTSVAALASVSPTQSVTVSFTARVQANLADQTRISNQADLNATGLSAGIKSDDPATAPKGDPTVVVVRSRPDLTTSIKTAADVNGGQLLPGDTISYTITVRNTGNVAATNVRVTDRVDTNLTGVVAGQGGTLSGGVITWTIPSLASGATRTLTFTAQVKTPLTDGTKISNQAQLAAANAASTVTDDPSTPTDDDPTVVTVTSGPAFADTTKEVVDLNGGQANPGDRLRYTITVRNTGTDVGTNVVVTDKVDTANLNAVSPGQGGTFANGTITWNSTSTPALASVPVGGSVVLTFEATVLQGAANGTVIENQAEIRSQKVTTPVKSDDPRTVDQDDTTKVTVVAGSALNDSTKAVAGNTNPGDTLTYTIEVKNTGTGVARNVVVTDQVDTARLVNITPGQGGTFANGVITWNATTTSALATLAQGGTVRLTFTAQIAPGLLQGTQISNQATMTAADLSTPVPTDNPATPQLDDPTVVVVGGAPSLVVRKTASATTASPGDVVTYTIVVRNEGGAAATNVVINDPIDPNLEQINPANGGTYNAQSNRILWTIASIAPNTESRVTFTARLKANLFNGTIIANQAQVSSAEISTPVNSDNPATPAPNDATNITVSSPQRLVFTKTVRDLSPGGFRPGDTIEYTITIRNAGTSPVQRLVVRDRIDPNLEQIQPGQGGRFANGQILWDQTSTPALATLAAGASTTLTFRARILAATQDGTKISNQAGMNVDTQSVELLSDDPNQPDDTDPTDFVVAFPNMALTKTARDVNGGTYEAGDTVEYTITVRNAGSASLTNVVVTDPVNGQFLEQIQANQGGRITNGTIRWDRTTTPALAEVKSGDSVTLTFTVVIKSATQNGQNIANQASAVTSEITQAKPSDDPNTPPNDDPTVIVVRAAPNLAEFTKTVIDRNGGSVKPGDVLEYTLTIKNNGSLPATNVVVRDPVSSNLTNIQPSDNGRFVAGTIVWNAQTSAAKLSTIAPGATVTLTFTAVVNAQAPDGAIIDNQAEVQSQEITTAEKSDDPSTPQPDDPTRVTVQAAATFTTSLKAVTVVGGGSAQPGSVIEYTINVINSGNRAASQVRLVDPTPANTEFVTGSLRVNGVVIPDGGTNPLSAGINVQSARTGTQAGIVLPDDGAAPNDEWATVVFRVRVRAGVANQTRIRNSALVSASGLSPIRTNEVVVIVGGGPNLDNTSKSYSLAVDRQTQGVADVGDVLEYSITVRNAGANATNVVFTDAIPNNTQYVPGSITLQGAAQTDTADNDPSQFQANVGAQGTVRVNIGTLAQGQSRVITFRVTIQGGQVISNQGFVSATNQPREGTDSDDNDANGDQPTLTPVGTNRLLTAIKEVLDVTANGGVNPGDLLEYRITLRNSGSTDIADIKVTDVMPQNTTFEANSAQGPGTSNFDAATRTLTFTGISLTPNQTALLVFRVKINAGVADGTKITNIADVEAAQVNKFQTDPAEVTVQQGGSQATLSGLIFQDYGANDIQFDASEDELLPGFKVKIYNANDLTQVVQETTSNDQGQYRLENLPTGQYKVRYYTSKDVQFGEFDVDLTQGGEVTRNIIVEPTGRVYNSASGSLLADALVYLVYDDGANKTCREDKDCSTDEVCVKTQQTAQSGSCFKKVADADLLEKQQGQPTNTRGMYKFSAPVNESRTYRLAVRAGSASVFPSTTYTPQSGVAQYASFSDNGKIVDHDVPDLQDANKPKTYFLEFNVTEVGKIVQNNHIPVDILGSLIVLTKSASRNSATVGDIITYTLELKNNSSTPLNYDSVRRVGGAYITDILPKGFQMLTLSPRGSVNNGKLFIARPKPVSRNGATTTASRIFRFGPFSVPAQSTLVLRYQAVVGRQLPVGEYINVAHAHNSAGGRLTPDARAMVRVIYDPILDQGTVIGKVFCDKNKNRYQDPGETGVEGVRIYLDTGFYTTTDRYGKYHLQAIDPGNHMLKVDKQTLPPGSKMIDTPDQVFYVSRGLFRKINFAITCTGTQVRTQRVYLAGRKKAVKAKSSVFKIEGSVVGPRLTVNGRQRALPRVSLAVGLPGKLPRFGAKEGIDIDMKGSQLKQNILFHMRLAPGFAPSDWRLEVFRKGPGTSTGALLRTFKGTGTPPASLPWDGLSPSGRFVLRRRRLYIARLFLTTHQGEMSQSPWRVFGVGNTRVAPRVLWKRRIKSDYMGKRRGSRVRRRLKRRLRRYIKRLRRLLKKPNTRLEIEVHHDNRMRRTRALFLTVRRAGALRRYFRRALKMPGVKIKASGFGSSRPRLPNISRRNRRRNRRIVMRVVRVESRKALKIKQLSFRPSVELGGKLLAVTARGTFTKTVKLSPKRNMRLKISTADGAFVELPLRPKKLSKSELKASNLLPVPIGKRRFPNFDPGVILRQKRKLVFSFKDNVGDALSSNLSARPTFRLYLATASIEKMKRAAKQVPRHARLRVAQAKTDTPQPATPKSKAKAPAKPTAATKKPPVPWEATKGKGAAKAAKAKAVKGKKGKKVVRKKKIVKKDPVKDLVSVPASQAKNVLAAKLVIKLPPKNALIRKSKLLLQGNTHASNELTVNGQKLIVQKNGRFRGYVKLKHGQKKLVVRCKDKLGNYGEIVWPVHVNLNRLFLMGFVDTAIAQSTAKQLEGFNDHSSFQVSDFIFHGRAVLYAKGRLLGKHFLSKVFKKIKFTAHFDSAKKRELEEFYRQLIDPERFYPIYGDGSDQVQDVVARNKVYVLIEADRSKLIVGNYRTNMRGIELKRYDRTFYGLDVDFRKRFAKHFDTRARFFMSDGESKQLKAHVELRGTGGSLYYLKHRQLLEGSEQVRLTVRDKDSNIILAQMALTRNEHYNIQYYDGRLFFKYPIPTVVDSFVLTQHNLNVTLDGHPVFIEVDYEYEAVEGQNALAFGTRVEQGLWDKLRLGFSFVQEGRKDNPNPYRLWGFDLTFEWDKGTYVKAEFARSESFDSQSYLSIDGGLSFQQIQFAYNNLNLERPNPSQPRNISGNAVVVRAAVDVGKLAKWKKVGLSASSYFTWREDGFFASGQTQEQGSIKGGALVHVTLFDKHKIRLKYDGISLRRFDIITSRLYDYEQHIANLGYTFHFLPNWDATVEYSFTSNYDQRAENQPGNKATLFGNFVTLGANWKVNKIFSVLLRQQLAFATESRQPLTIMDHFATTVGLNLQVFKGTFLSGTGTVRWSGNTSAQIGLKTQLNKDTSAYVREQFNFAQQGTGLGHTLVVGAAKSLAKNSKVYGEYQLDGSFSGNSSRAVIGLSHIFPLFKGFYIGAGFERAQFLDASTGNNSRTVGRITLNFTRFKQLKATGRYEIRFDDNDNNVGLVGDRIQFVTTNNVVWQFTPDIGFMARVNYALTHNASFNNGEGGTEGEIFEATGGIAFRPVQYDWLNLLLKYTHRQEVRPLGLLGDNRAQRTTNEVLSLVPIVELPFKLQLVEQVAVRFRQEEIDGLQPASSITFMWINRLNFHLLKRLDIGVEYRFMWMWYGSAGQGLTTPANLPKTFDHGLLVEASYNIHQFVYVGLGYNFSSFSDNMFVEPTRDYSGFFLRVVGKY